jgi:type II secretory pathway predicted ATPase ExeA
MKTPTIPEHHQRRLQAHFAFSKLPFRKDMPANQMFGSRSQRDLHHGLVLWTEIHGLSVVTGPSGVGKSITVRKFISDLADARFHVLRVSYLPTTVTGFLRSLNRLLGLPLRLHPSDMFDAAQTYLAHYADEHGAHPLLILDDAEGLSVALLDLLRRLTAYDLDADDRFSILLTGTDDLLATLRDSALDSFRSRIGYAQTLRPFSFEDSHNYIGFHLQRASADAKLFSEEACRRIFHASQGKPRHINQLALHGLIQAAVHGLDTIDGDFMNTQIAAHPLYANPGADR